MSLSLDASLRTCKVDTAWASRVQSDRFENPNEMSCPVFTGFDLAGRQVNPDSFYTKSAGCNSALDRVDVENNLRPQYAEYINLSASGIDASIYGNFNNNMSYEDRGKTQNVLNNNKYITGQFGANNFSGQVYPACGTYPYNRAMKQVANSEKVHPAAHHVQENYGHNGNNMGYVSNNNNNSGFTYDANSGWNANQSMGHHPEMAFFKKKKT
jgi:hypothetical protein